MPPKIKVLFLAAEAEPFIKVGGLADVAGSLPVALRSLPLAEMDGGRLDVRLVLPHHAGIHLPAPSRSQGVSFSVPRHSGGEQANVEETSLHGMPVYLISGTPLDSAPGVYSSNAAQDREKYVFFSMAALELIHWIGWQPDILHANDWHTALSVYGLPFRSTNPGGRPIRSVLTLHNLPYMGGDATEQLASYDLLPLQEPAFPEWARSQPLPLGLWSADAIVPVSPTYACEILTPDFGCDLDPYLRSKSERIHGILNGLDVEIWNPTSDPCLPVVFDAGSLDRRADCKAALQNSLALPIEPGVPILAMVGRIDRQKGIDLALDVLRQCPDVPWQFVLLGSGDSGLEELARSLQTSFPERVRAVIRFDADLGHLIYAGADVFLMPSRYEPCGLAQMIAMRYGCVPVVRATGGLKDTVQEGQTGFLFEGATTEDLRAALLRALETYGRPQTWRVFQQNDMRQDFSWGRSAKEYAILYQSLLSGGRDLPPSGEISSS
jgi:starch synthase